MLFAFFAGTSESPMSDVPLATLARPVDELPPLTVIDAGEQQNGEAHSGKTREHWVGPPLPSRRGVSREAPRHHRRPRLVVSGLANR